MTGSGALFLGLQASPVFQAIETTAADVTAEILIDVPEVAEVIEIIGKSWSAGAEPLLSEVGGELARLAPANSNGVANAVSKAASKAPQAATLALSALASSAFALVAGSVGVLGVTFWGAPVGHPDEIDGTPDPWMKGVVAQEGWTISQHPERPAFAYPLDPNEEQLRKAVNSPSTREDGFKASAAQAQATESVAEADSPPDDDYGDEEPEELLDLPFVDGMFRLTTKGRFQLVANRYSGGMEEAVDRVSYIDGFNDRLRAYFEQGHVPPSARSLVERVREHLNARLADPNVGVDDRKRAATWNDALRIVLEGTPANPIVIQVPAPSVRELALRNGVSPAQLFNPNANVDFLIPVLQQAFAVSYATALNHGDDPYQTALDFQAWLDTLAPRADGRPHLPAGQAAHEVMLSKLAMLSQYPGVSPAIEDFVFETRDARENYDDQLQLIFDQMEIWERTTPMVVTTATPSEHFVWTHRDARAAYAEYEKDRAMLGLLQHMREAFRQAGYDKGADELSAIIEDAKALIHDLDTWGGDFLSHGATLREYEFERNHEPELLTEEHLDEYTDNMHTLEKTNSFARGKEDAGFLHSHLKGALEKLHAVIARPSLFRCLVTGQP